jgi:hypothetical protein
VKLVKPLILLLKNWNRSRTSTRLELSTQSSTNSEKEGRPLAEDSKHSYNGYSTDQMAEIYAKLEVSKMLIKMGTDMAKQIEADIKFYKMTNNIEE